MIRILTTVCALFCALVPVSSLPAQTSSKGQFGGAGGLLNSPREPATPKNPKVAATPIAERTRTIDLVKVEIVDASVSKAHEIEVLGGKETRSEKEYAFVKFRVHNQAAKAPLPYYTWSYHAAFPISVKDADGKDVPIWKSQQLRPKGSWTYLAAGPKVSGLIKAKSSVVDVVAFELPENLQQDLTLELHGRNVGLADQAFTFTVPASWFAPADAPKKK